MGRYGFFNDIMIDNCALGNRLPHWSICTMDDDFLSMNHRLGFFFLENSISIGSDS